MIILKGFRKRYFASYILASVIIWLLGALGDGRDYAMRSTFEEIKKPFTYSPDLLTQDKKITLKREQSILINF